MGKQEAWYLFAIPYPGGANAEYHYATVRIFSTPEQLESPGNFGAALEKAHPGGNIEEMMDRVWKTRDLVKTHRLFSWENFSADDLEAPPSILQVVYFKVPLEKENAYQQMEREVYHPMHKKEIEKGRRVGWEGWALNAPWGSSQAYTHIAVDMYKDWEQYTSPNIEGLLEEVHPGKTQDELTEIFTNTADLVNMEEWRLVDFAVKQ